MSNTLSPAQPNTDATASLDRSALAAEIEAGHERCQQRTVDLAAEWWVLGKLLIDARADIGRHFRQWLEENISFSRRAAYLYIAFHERHPDGLPKGAGDLTLTDRTGSSGPGSEEITRGKGGLGSLGTLVNRFEQAWSQDLVRAEIEKDPAGAKLMLRPLYLKLAELFKE